MKDLHQLRQHIDALDEEILSLLHKRAEIVINVGKFKEKENANPVYMRHEREAQILRRITENAQQKHIPIHANDLQNIYREIIASCRSLESPMQIAYLGPAGTYSEIVAKKYFSDTQSNQFLPQETIHDIFDEVENERVSYGIVPIENSYEGYVTNSTDALIAMKHAHICAEIKMHIKHSFLSNEENIQDVNKLYVHQQSYAQCSEWIEQHQTRWQIEFVQSNGLAAQLASTTPKSAAIASPQAAKEYQLTELQQKIQNQSNNTTRFLIIGNHPVGISGNDITTLAFTLKNEAGALQKALQILADKNINMTQIISRPTRSTNQSFQPLVKDSAEWTYTFIIDVSGHQEEGNIAAGITELRDYLPMLKVLGSYPISPTI